ncbi:hypothetical protein QTH90_04935 [Variovorax sp. J2P1-59]|uniref:hypothetical protein n=1 Tax=Variovorax flavidus TaxID=3053501 RepID=UPI002575AAC9|nr:hypothetical protein [Variovorax sp. J2P1-59]MDM0073712.1 hypothetical protein [Variovorax sp. J2P1-59]
MKTSSVAALAVSCAFVLGCDMQPSVLFVATGSAFHMLQLTDAQEECASPFRICFLNSWDGGTARGCWVREQSNVRARFPGTNDKLIPVTEFRRTTLADYRNAELE